LPKPKSSPLPKFILKKSFLNTPIPKLPQLPVKSYPALLCSILLTGCGYQWMTDEKITLSVPYVAGDLDGTLTSEIIRLLSAQGVAHIAMTAEYRLEVQILDDQNHVVGYRKDPQKVSGKIRKDLVSSEGRRSVSAQVTLYRGDTIIQGPYTLTADADYDYVDGDSLPDLAFTSSDGVFTTVLPFSLGQLESIESAQEATSSSLYTKLAQKIIHQTTQGLPLHP
jgi:hypothetical protein